MTIKDHYREMGQSERQAILHEHLQAQFWKGFRQGALIGSAIGMPILLLLAFIWSDKL